MTTTADNDKRKRLYDNLVSKGHKLPDYATFSTDMADVSKRQRLHGSLTKKGYKIPDYNTFSADIAGDLTPSFQEPLQPLTTPAPGAAGGVSPTPSVTPPAPSPTSSPQDGIQFDEAGMELADATKLMPRLDLPETINAPEGEVKTAQKIAAQSKRFDESREQYLRRAATVTDNTFIPEDQSRYTYLNSQQYQPTGSALDIDPRRVKAEQDFWKFADATGERNTQLSRRNQMQRRAEGSWTPRLQKAYELDVMQHEADVLAGREIKLQEMSQQGVDPEMLKQEAADIEAGKAYVREQIASSIGRDVRTMVDEYRAKEQKRTDQNDPGVLSDVFKRIRSGGRKFVGSTAAGAMRILDPSGDYTIADRMAETMADTEARKVTEISSAGQGAAIQDGKFRPRAALGMLGEGSAQMLGIIATGGVGRVAAGAAGQNAAVIGSSYLQGYNDYVTQAIEGGAKKEDIDGAAKAYATVYAAAERLINPQLMGAGKPAARSAFIQTIKSGGTPAQATKAFLEGGGKEFAEEMVQNGAEAATNAVVNSMSGTNLDEEITAEDVANAAFASILLGGIAEVGMKPDFKSSKMKQEAVTWAATNPREAAQLIDQQVPEAERDKFKERLVKLAKTYNGNELTGLDPDKAAEVADVIERADAVKENIKVSPMNPALKAAQGDPREKVAASLTAQVLEAKGITSEDAALSMANEGMLKVPAGAKLSASPDGKVSLEVEAKEGETGPTRASVMEDLVSQYNSIKETPPAAPTSVEEGGGAVTPEAATTTDEERTTTEAAPTATPTDIGTSPGVPPDATATPEQVEPRRLSPEEAKVLTDKLSTALGASMQWDADQLGRAYVKGGVVYLNPDKVTIDTPLHEVAGHILLGRLAGGNQRDRALHRRAIDLAKEAPQELVDAITEAYPELTPGTQRFHEEVFSTYLGLLQPNAKMAEKILAAAKKDKTFMERFLELIRHLANRAGDLAGLTRSGLMKAKTLEELAEGVGTAAYGGRKITSSKAVSETVEHSKAELLDIMDNENDLGNPIALTGERLDRFKDWFGDSKIVDRQGRPMVMYHGTARDFNAFKPKQAQAIFISPDPGFASLFSDGAYGWMAATINGRLDLERKRAAYEAFDKFQKGLLHPQPLEAGGTILGNTSRVDAVQNESMQVLQNATQAEVDEEKNNFNIFHDLSPIGRASALVLNAEFGPVTYPVYASVQKLWDYHNPKLVEELVDAVVASNNDPDTPPLDANTISNLRIQVRRGEWSYIELYTHNIRELGFDGFRVSEYGQDNIGVFEPTQIKSVYGNDGGFSGTDPDINHSKAINHKLIAKKLNAGDGLTGDAEKVADTLKKQAEAMKAAQKKAEGTLYKAWVRGFEDTAGIAKQMAREAGAHKAVRNRILQGGASAAAKQQWKNFYSAIYSDLSTQEEELLNSVLQIRRTIAIDERRDADGVPRPAHTGGMTSEQGKEYLEQLRNKQPEVMRDIDARADSYFNAQRELLKQKLDEGRINQDLYDRLSSWDYARRAYLHHVEDTEASNGASIYGSRAARSDIRALGEGSEEALFNDFRYLLKAHTLSTYKTNFENATNKELGKLAQSDPNNGLLEMVDPIKTNNDGSLQFPVPKTGFDHIVYFDGGVEHHVEAPAEFVVQWSEADPLIKPQLANAVRVISGGSFKRMMLTGANPAFAAANFFRDFAHIITVTNAYSKHLPVATAQLTKDIGSVVIDALKRGKLTKQYIEDGGGMDFLTSQGRPLLQKGLGPDNSKIDKGLHVLGYLNEWSELTMRLALYKRMIDRGTREFKAREGRPPGAAEQKEIRRDATAAARDQMDFSQGGAASKAIDHLIPYTNAALQGTRVMVRYAKTNPKLFAYKLAQLGGLAMGLAAYAISGSPDDWDDISEEVKARNFIFFLPWREKDKNGTMRRKYLKFAKSHEQAVFAGLFESMVELILRGKYPTSRVITDFQTSLPLIDPSNIPVVDAMNAYATGYDTFRDRSVSPKMNKVEPWREYQTGKTPEFLINVGKSVADAEGFLGVNEGDRGLSPDRLKLAAEKMAGQPEGNLWYSILGKGYNIATEGIGVNERRELDKGLSEHVEDLTKPLTKRFIGETYPADRIDDLHKEQKKAETSAMDQNDSVRGFLLRRKDAGDAERKKIDAETERYIMEQPDHDRKRLRDRYRDGAKLKDVDYYYIILRNTSSPEARAMSVYQESSALSKEKRDEMWKEIDRVGGIRGERFDAEYRRLKKAALQAE